MTQCRSVQVLRRNPEGGTHTNERLLYKLIGVIKLLLVSANVGLGAFFLPTQTNAMTEIERLVGVVITQLVYAISFQC